MMKSAYNWQDIEYLKYGNIKQKKIYDILISHNILNILHPYTPAVVSTICVGLDIDSSDIDIICYTNKFIKYKDHLISNFSKYSRFKIRNRQNKTTEIVCSFFINNIEIEIFCNNIAVEEQNAYKHLTVMQRLIDIGKDDFTHEIQKLKKSGLKTEPAIAKYLSLSGNAYEAVLNLFDYSENELFELIKQKNSS